MGTKTDLKAETFVVFVYTPKHPFRHNGAIKLTQDQGRTQGESTRSIAPPKTYESIFIHHHFSKFGKQPSRYKSVLSSVALSQQCYEVYFISLAVVNP